jgi:hypothetical protein
VRPYKYRGEEGGASVNVDFNWQSMRATGTSENKPHRPAARRMARRT